MPQSIQTIAESAHPFLARIETLMGEIASEKAACMARCRELQSDIKAVFVEAKNTKGVQKKPLRDIIKRRALQNKIEGLGQFDDQEESQQYDAFVLAFAGTPMGEYVQANGPQGAEAEAETQAAPKTRRSRRNAVAPIEHPATDSGDVFGGFAN
jgi:hypothetical protein